MLKARRWSRRLRLANRTPDGGRGGPYFEPLEQRVLLSLLGTTPEYPLIVYDNQGTLNYDAATDLLDIHAEPKFFRADPTSTPSIITANPGDVRLRIEVDDTGALIGGTPGDDFTVNGDIDLDGDTNVDVSGLLLSGEIIDFGFRDSGGTTDLFDFHVAITGGQLTTNPLTSAMYAGRGLVVTTTSEQSNFTDDFTVDFDGEAKGNIGTTLLGSLHVFGFEDMDADGNYEPPTDTPWEAALPGKLIELFDESGNFIESQLTNDDGEAWFTDLWPGTYQLQESLTVFQGTAIMPSPDPDGAGPIPGGAAIRTVTIGSGEELVWRPGAAAGMLKPGQVEVLIDPDNSGINEDLIFGNFIKGSIHAYGFEDLDADGNLDPTDVAWDVNLPGKKIDLFDVSGNFITTQTTDINGEVWFENLTPGTYMLQEDLGVFDLDDPQDPAGDNVAPTVTKVLVGSTDWNQLFRDHLTNAGLGNDLGYAIPTNGDQLDTLTWTDLDQVSLVFSDDVIVQQSDLQLAGVNVNSYGISGFNYDSPSRTATWTLASGIGPDKLLIALDDAVTDVQGNALDGEWAMASGAASSGDGAAGGDFLFRLNVLPGDIDHSTIVLGNDITAVRNAQLDVAGMPGFRFQRDIDGSGVVLGNDIIAVRNPQLTFLPSGDPVNPLPPEASTGSNANNHIMPSPDPDGPGGVPGGADKRMVVITSGKELVWRDGATHGMLEPGQEEELVDDGRLVFGNFIKGSIHAYDFEDLEADGILDPHDIAWDENLPGKKIDLFDVDGNLIESQTTDSTGQVWFLNLVPGTYVLQEDLSVFGAAQNTPPGSSNPGDEQQQDGTAPISGDLCGALGHASQLTFQYSPGTSVATGQGPRGASVLLDSGFVDDDGTSHIVVTDGRGTLFFGGDVAIGETFDAIAANGSFAASVFIHFFDD